MIGWFACFQTGWKQHVHRLRCDQSDWGEANPEVTPLPSFLPPLLLLFFFRRGFCYCHGWLYFTFLPERHVLNTLELCYKFHFKSVPCSIALVIMCPVSFICLYLKQLALEDLKFPSNRLKMNSISCSFIRY